MGDPASPLGRPAAERAARLSAQPTHKIATAVINATIELPNANNHGGTSARRSRCISRRSLVSGRVNRRGAAIAGAGIALSAGA